MGLEGIKSHSLALETKEESEKRVESLANQEVSLVEEEAFPSKEENEVIAQNASGVEVPEQQQVAAQAEAAELLKKMHEAVGMKTETETPSLEDKELDELLGITSSKETSSSPEQPVQQEEQEAAEKLYESLNLSTAGKDHDGFYEQGSRGAVDEEGGSIQSKLASGLAGEQFNNEKKRGKFFKGALLTSTVGFIGGLGGVIGADVAGGTLLGLSGSTIFFGGLLGVAVPAIAIGGLGWAGMKAYHSWKERRHAKTFDNLTHGY
jgi:hypothetical protein